MKEQLKAFLAESSGIAEIDENTELFSTGIVNSLFAIQLVMYLERSFKIEIGMDDLNMDNFNSISAICSFIENKQLAAA